MLHVFIIQKWHFIYIHLYFYYVGKICTDITPTNSRAKWEDYMKAWNYITIDFHQEMDQEYSTIVQIIVKADRGKAITWRSVRWWWHVITCQTKKLYRFSVCILCPLCSLHSTFCIRCAVCSLHFVLTGNRGTNTVYFWLQLFAKHT